MTVRRATLWFPAYAGMMARDAGNDGMFCKGLVKGEGTMLCVVGWLCFGCWWVVVELVCLVVCCVAVLQHAGYRVYVWFYVFEFY